MIHHTGIRVADVGRSRAEAKRGVKEDPAA